MIIHQLIESFFAVILILDVGRFQFFAIVWCACVYVCAQFLPCRLALFWRPVVWVVSCSCRRRRRAARTVAPPRGGRLPGSRSRSSPES